MSLITLTKLGSADYPWRFSLRVVSMDHDSFERFIDALKERIPSRDRKWDRTDRRWLLRDCVVALAIAQTQGVTVAYDDPPPTSHRPHVLDRAAALRLLHLQPDAPDWLIQAAYRAAAKKLHPDAGGDVEQMQAINQAMEVLR